MTTPQHDAIEALARALSRIRSAHATDELGHECSPDTPCRWCVLQAEQATAAIAALDGYHLVPDTTPTSEREAWIRRSAQNLIDYPEILDLLALLDAERAARLAAEAAGMLAARDFHMAAFRGQWPGEHTSSVIEECPNEMCVKHVAALRLAAGEGGE